MEQDKENVSIIILDTDLVSFGLWLVRHVEKNLSALKLQGLHPPHWLSFNPQKFDPWEYAQNFSLSFSFDSALSAPDKPRAIRCEITRREHNGFQVKISSSIQMDALYLDQLSNAIKQHWQEELIEAESGTPTFSLEESSLLLLKRLYNKVEANVDIAVSASELVNDTSAQDKTGRAIFHLVGEGWAKFDSGTRDVRITQSGIEEVRSSFPNPESYQSPNTSTPPAQSCANCHFLMKQVDGRPFEVTLQNRESIRNQDYSWLRSHYSLGCYLSVWDEGYNFEIGRRHEVIVLTGRENDCFFWPYKPGMLFPTAVELQKREAGKLSNIQLPKDSAITAKEMVSGTENITVDIVISGILNQGGIQYFEAPVEIDMSETTINSQGDVVQGDQVIMSGDFRGAIVNVKSQLDRVTQTINALPYGSDEQKQAFNQLVEQLKAELAKAPPEQAKEAEKVSKRVEALARELDEEEPDKEMVEITGESLMKAAQNVATVLPDVIDIATKIVAAALAFWA